VHDDLGAALDAAGSNRQELARALSEVAPEQRDAMRFLIENMPPGDLLSLKADFLLAHVAEAHRDLDYSRRGGKTRLKIPREIFLNDISIGLAAREQTTNLYRVAYDLSRFDFTAVTPIINDITGAVTYPVRLYAIARDSNNNQTVSSTTNLTINPATSAPPSIQLVAATPTNITAGTQFFMQANMNDNDGVVTTIQLYANGSLVATIGNPQQGQFLTYTANNAGRFNLYAVVTDDTGNTAVSSPSIVVNVTAVSAPTTTITRPTDNATTATVGSPVFLEGTAVNTATTMM
jgi:hypothetical protein